MNKVFQILSVAVIVLTAASCGSGKSEDSGVVINGVKWATRYIDRNSKL
ncbi:MAG: hypothetical protein LBU22_00065 [Dysgonamonadaceae bacterium]|jgi:hypothetical protein|nr:hypothetical protein [Dysgonamonadaceae bacterium]